jgi:hypothetical protein
MSNIKRVQNEPIDWITQSALDGKPAHREGFSAAVHIEGIANGWTITYDAYTRNDESWDSRKVGRHKTFFVEDLASGLRELLLRIQVDISKLSVKKTDAHKHEVDLS